MRTTACISPFGAICLLLTLTLTGGCSGSSELDFGAEPTNPVSIGYLKSLCDKQSVRVTEPISVKGIVIGNDHYKEFNRTLVIEANGEGISVAVDRTDLYTLFPYGAEVVVYCNGLTLNDYGGKILLGTTPGDDGPGRIPADEAARYIRRLSAGEVSPVGRKISPEVISIADADTYVRLDGVHFVETGAWCDTDPETDRLQTTERQIADQAGNTFTVRTLGTCSYAKEPVPTGTGSLCGIVDYFNGKYTLRITNCQTEFVTVEGRSTAYP